jgi:hypothetical protein
VCSYSCFAVQSPDDALQAITFLEIFFGEIHCHGFLLQIDLIFEIVNHVFHPFKFRYFSFNVEIFGIHKVFPSFIFGIVFITRHLKVWCDSIKPPCNP